MAKCWYPVVDYAICAECGSCVQKCPHGVYDIKKTPSPVVIKPEDCVDHCHGCGNRCPVGAITYVGDDTGWMPPNGNLEPEEPCCACGCGDKNIKSVFVEYLYLDLKTCDRCVGTDHVLDEVMLILTPALKLAGYEVAYHKIEIKTADLAKQYNFLSSPTIRVNGKDICGEVKENRCGCCSDISDSEVDCRVFEYNGESYEVPPKEMLAKAVLDSVFGNNDCVCSCDDYVLPENLRVFFEGKKKVSACSCSSGCC